MSPPTSSLGHCAACEHFAVDLKVSNNIDRQHDGFCHANPPQVMIVPSGGRLVAKSMFPAIKNDEWCGAFRPGPGTDN